MYPYINLCNLTQLVNDRSPYFFTKPVCMAKKKQGHTILAAAARIFLHICMCIYVSICRSIYVSISIYVFRSILHICICKHNTYACTHTHTHAHTHTHKHKHTHIVHACVCVYMRSASACSILDICICLHDVCMYVFICTNVSKYKQVYM